MDGGTGPGGHHELRRLRIRIPLSHARRPDEAVRRPGYRHPQPAAGAAIRTVRTADDPEAHFLSFTEGYKLFKGKIADVLRETRAGFNFGRVLLEGIGECKGRSAAVEFQNENLTAEVDGKIVATVPDLICLVDTETFAPVTTDALKYGKRVLVVGLRCFELWRCPAGLELVGPRYFGVDTDYIPLEERCKEVCPHV